jgi:hypothetical protein
MPFWHAVLGSQPPGENRVARSIVLKKCRQKKIGSVRKMPQILIIGLKTKDNIGENAREGGKSCGGGVAVWPAHGFPGMGVLST